MEQGYTRLRKCNSEQRQDRFYALSVQPNLFGSWSLIREWGRVGTSSRVHIDLYDSEAEALRCMQRKRHEKQRRGYG